MPLSPRWRARLVALLLFGLALTIATPAVVLLLARTIGAAVTAQPAELVGLGASVGVGGACLVAAYWVLIDSA